MMRMDMPASSWHLKRLIALGWYDGPTEGFLWLEQPSAELYFKLLEEAHEGRYAGTKLVALYEVPVGTIQQVEHVLSFAGPAVGRWWIPLWRHSDEKVLRQAEDQLAELMADKKDLRAVLAISEAGAFNGPWALKGEGKAAEMSWFEHLRIPPSAR
jgi:hypothetical protein